MLGFGPGQIRTLVLDYIRERQCNLKCNINGQNEIILPNLKSFSWFFVVLI